MQSVIDSVEDSEDENTHSMDHTDHPMESQVAQEYQGSNTVPCSTNSPNDTANEESSQDVPNNKSFIVAKNACTGTKRKYSQNLSAPLNPADDAFIKWMKYKQDRDSNSNSNINEHPNMLFLRSLFPDLMKMTDKQNRRFRQKVIGLIDDIIEDNDIFSPRPSASDIDSPSLSVYCPRPSPSESVQSVQSPMQSPRITVQGPIPHRNESISEWSVENQGNNYVYSHSLMTNPNSWQ